jgi:hypothetical protein
MKKIVLIVILVLACSAPDGWAQKKTSKPDNIITRENSNPGTTDWILTNVTRHEDEPYDEGWHRRTEIEGYVSHMSIKAGDTLNIYVSTDPPSDYMIEIFRMGFYGGKGGRLMTTFSPQKGLAAGIKQPTPVDGQYHIMECNWKVSAKLKIPEDWVSGVYLGKLSIWRNIPADAYFVFVVKDDRKADLLFQVSDFTWQSYNRWPQWRSMYDSPNNPWGTRIPESYAAGFDRPYALFWNGYPGGFEPLTNGSGEFLMTEFPLAYWLEREGYDVSYISQMDVHENGPTLLRSKVYLSVGHDEYLTEECYQNIIKARDAGVNLAFLCGNAISGRVQLLTGTKGIPNRGMRYIGHEKGNFDDVELLGAKSYGVGLADWICASPDHWAFEGTGMKKGDIVPQLVGWEYHGPPLAENHKDLVVLAEGPVTNYYGVPNPRKRTYATTIYTASRGNYVFNAATCWWNKVMSSPPGYINPPFINHFKDGDARIQRITKNILDRMISVQIK